MNRPSYYARAALYIARANASDREFLPYLDRLASRALRAAKVAKANHHPAMHALASDLIAEINIARALLRRGHYRRARMSFLSVADLTVRLSRNSWAMFHGVNIHAPAPSRLRPALTLAWRTVQGTAALASIGAFGAGVAFLSHMLAGVL